jgi:transposase
MSVMEQEPVRTRRSFTPEFKRDAVAIVLDEGHTIADVARRLGVGEGTLGTWVRQERTDRGERAGLTTSEKAELAELRRENARLRMDRSAARSTWRCRPAGAPADSELNVMRTTAARSSPCTARPYARR